jgi:SSS family solute:Na+ symporter
MAGLISASLQFILDQNKDNFSEGTLLYELAHIHAIYLFPIIFGFSLLGSLLGTFLSKPTEITVLKSFYKNVHPWGWWNPVYDTLKAEDNAIEKNTDFWKDMLNCAIGIVWQSSMIVMPIYFVIRDYPKALISLIVFVITSIILKFTWFDKVRKITN